MSIEKKRKSLADIVCLKPAAKCNIIGYNFEEILNEGYKD